MLSLMDYAPQPLRPSLADAEMTVKARGPRLADASRQPFAASMFAAVLAVGISLASASSAHDVEGEMANCDRDIYCGQAVTCTILDGERVSYPTTCEAENCTPHSHDLTYCPDQPEEK